jgi:hypothetical protein
LTTAAANTDISNATVAVTAGRWQEANGNPGAGGTTAPFTVDSVTPTVAVSINSTDVNVANPNGKVTFTFSEAPTNFSLADTSATGGTLSNLTGSGMSYTATFTAAANTDIANAAVAVTAGSWQEGNGNPGGGGSTAPFTVDTVTPTISSITANPANAALNAGKSVTLSVTFSEVETVGGLTPATTPFLTLNDLGTATYTGGSGTNVLTFGYTVAAGQNTPDLAGTGLNLNGATIQDGGGNNADLSGAVTNPAGTLKIDTTPPTVTGVVSSPATGEATTGQLVSISLNMSEAVTVPGMVVLLLNDGAIANYDKSKSTATTAVFDYTVASSQVTTDLVVSGVGLASTSANTDLAGNATNFAGAGANLGLQVNTTATGNAGPSGGNFSLPGTAVLDLFGPSRASVTFAAGSTGTLELFDSQAFTGTIAGLAHGNHLDLADIGFGAGTKLGYTPNSGNTGGTLSITDGTHTANLALLGSYVAANFTMSSDGNGGTMVVDPPIGSPMNSQGLAPAHQ